MARETFKKVITSEEKWAEVNSKNKKLMDRFLKEKSTRCSSVTIKNYRSDLKIFFTWNMEENDDKYFPNIKKLDFSDFFAYGVEEIKMWRCVESAEYDEEMGGYFGVCEYHYGDFFCSYGERKDGDGNG